MYARVVATIASVCVLLGGVTGTSRAAGEAQTLPLVRVGVSPNDAALPIVYGVQAGIYKRHGIDVDVQKFAGSPVITSAISGGSLEIGQASTFNTIIAISKGVPFTVVGNLWDLDVAKPNVALIVAANSTIRTAKDLEGKTIGATTLTDSNTIAMLLWLQQRGVDTSNLKTVEVPAAASLAALEQNRIDATTVYEPFYTTFEATGKIRVLGFPYQAIGKHFSSSLLLADPKWVAANRDTLTRFLQASEESATYVAAHENETSVVSARFLGLDPAQMKSVRHPIRGTAIGASEIQPLIDVAFKFKLIPRMLAPDEILCSCAFHK